MKEIITIRIEILYKDATSRRTIFENTQDACSDLQTQKCYNRENRHK